MALKKFIYSLLLLTYSVLAHALPSGNPADPGLYCHGFFEEYCECWPIFGFFENKCFNFRLGFYGDYVFNRHLRIDASSNHSDIRRTEINTNAGEITLNLWNCLDIFATFGATTLSLNGATSAFEPSATGGNDTFVINTASDVSYSVGARALLWSCGPFYVGISGQYFTTRPKTTSIYSTFSSFVTTYVDNVRFKYHEWQVNGGIAYRACFASQIEVIPYINLLGGNVHVSFGNPTVEINPGGGGATAAFTATLLDLQSQRHFGYAIGMCILGYERVSIGIEGRFSDEKALCFNAQFRL